MEKSRSWQASCFGTVPDLRTARCQNGMLGLTNKASSSVSPQLWVVTRQTRRLRRRFFPQTNTHPAAIWFNGNSIASG